MTTPDIPETVLKVQDAAVQLRLAFESQHSEAIVRSCINSFISAARSVTLVMQRESSVYPDLVAGYERLQPELAASPLFKFFNEARVHSIHRGVVRPRRDDIQFKAIETNFLNVPPDELEARWRLVAGPEAPVMQLGDIFGGNNTDTVSFWTFEDIQRYIPGDSGNVFRLCNTYLRQLQDILSAWLAERDRLIGSGLTPG